MTVEIPPLSPQAKAELAKLKKEIQDNGEDDPSPPPEHETATARLMARTQENATEIDGLRERLDQLEEEVTGREKMRLEMGERLGNRMYALENLYKRDAILNTVSTHDRLTALETEVGEQDKGLEASAVYAGMSEDRLKALEEHNEKWDATLAVFDAEQIAQGFAAHRAALAKAADRIEALEDNWLRMTKAATPEE